MSAYKLGGTVYWPSETDAHGSSYFSYQIEDSDAIAVAETNLSAEFDRLRPNWVMGATLWSGNRIVKNYPDAPRGELCCHETC